jgi:GNAT superfamily N-acetyltransferase
VIRSAAPEDEAALDAFLARHSPSSMFLRGNLAAHGLGPSDNHHATRYLMYLQGDVVGAVLGLTKGGMILCQSGDCPSALAPLVAELDGAVVTGVTGDADQTARVIELMGLQDSMRRDVVEPLFYLPLQDLRPGADVLRRPDRGDLALMTDWFKSYLVETGLAEPDATTALAAADRASGEIAGDDLRLLMVNGQPVAMAAINARAGTSVQVGGVFVPPALRNRGFGRSVIRALLAEARAEGATEAVLFSNNDAASSAYRSQGFTQVGRYRIAFLTHPQTIRIPT